MDKKRVLRNILKLTGLSRACWPLRNARLYCFNFHRIGNPEDCPFDRGVYSGTVEQFRAQLAAICDLFQVIDLDRLQATIEFEWRPCKPLALITFDDGYLDNFTLAYPVLKEFGVPAVFFIPTAFVETNKLPWWDAIAWMLRQASVERIQLGGPGSPTFSLAANALELTIQQVLRLVKGRHWIPMAEQVAEIREACRPGRSIDSVDPPKFMNWEQLRAMLSGGMDIGSHTHNHHLLAHLSPADQRNELATSKEMLEGQLGCETSAVAYPVGKAGAYLEQTCRLAKSLGYRLGFNYRNTTTALPTDNPFDIGRQDIEGDRTTADLRSRLCFSMLS